MANQNIQTAFELLKDELFSNIGGNGSGMVHVTLDCFLGVKMLQEKYNQSFDSFDKSEVNPNILKFPVLKKEPPKSLRRTPERMFEPKILTVLKRNGGFGSVDFVSERVFEMMETDFNDLDMALLSNGEPRWRNTLRWSVSKMKKRGVLSSQSLHGVWELADINQRH